MISLISGIRLSLKSKERIQSLAETKQKLEAEQKKLVDQQTYVQTPYYLEKVARDELHLARPGETVVIVPEGTMTEDRSQKIEGSRVEKANWQKWWGVITGSD